ncbi:MAG: hypothetical protein ACU84Q_21330 [Gammaproteobacteria bacterium]
MKRRTEMDAATISGVASRNAGHPLENERAERYTETMETLLQMMDSLRALPLKDIEPAIVFSPGSKDNDR